MVIYIKPTVIIRDAEKEDLKACVDLLRVPELMFAEKTYPDEEYLKNYLETGLFLVAEEEKKVVGCVFGETLKGKIAMVWFFVVSDKLRGRGIGNDLLSHFEERCKDRGVEWILLYSPTNSPKSLAFYEKKGFNKGNSFFEFTKRL